MKRSKVLSLFVLFSYLLYLWLLPSQIVDARQLCSSRNFYDDFTQVIQSLEQKYSEVLRVEIIGKSLDQRNIYLLKLGKGKKEILINAGHHAREYMTTVLLLDQIESIAAMYIHDKESLGVNVRKLLDEVSILFVPLVNPDGVELVTSGLTNISNKMSLSDLVYDENSLKVWKANLRGVDLNRNYSTEREYMKDRSEFPGPYNYPGQVPFSEPETNAMKQLCFSHIFELTISYHSAGEVIYWFYNQDLIENEQRDHRIALKLQDLTGYKLVEKQPNPSGGGFKDWYISVFRKPSYTLEIGKTSNGLPLSYSEYRKIWADNRSVPILAAILASEELQVNEWP